MPAVAAAQSQETVRQDAALEKGVELVLDEMRQVGPGGSLQPPKSWTWWDYRNLAFRKNQGLRIDHALVSDALRARVSACTIHKLPRKNERPSDHVPVVVELSAS